MSRYAILSLNLDHQVYVGWDHPLKTFFGQVYDITKSKDDNPVHWVGTSLRELYEVADLEKAMRPYARLSIATKSDLYTDKDEGN